MERDNEWAREVTRTDRAVHATITLAGVAMAFRRDVSLYASSILQNKCASMCAFVSRYLCQQTRHRTPYFSARALVLSTITCTVLVVLNCKADARGVKYCGQLVPRDAKTRR